MREAGDVCYADVYKDGTGMVEFLRYEDMKYAIKKLDDSRFRSHEVSHNSAPFFTTVTYSFNNDKSCPWTAHANYGIIFMSSVIVVMV